MKRGNFKLWHSVAGTAVLLVVESALVHTSLLLGVASIIFVAAVGAVLNLYVATEVIEQIKEARHMLELLSVLMIEFIVFFAFQYLFLITIEPGSFPTLPSDVTSLLLHSTMIFAFNPLYLPATADGRLLLLINTLSGLGLVFFILQNIWQFRRGQV